jgi:glutamate---cysteine ligase / carboxylate-amine ligase
MANDRPNGLRDFLLRRVEPSPSTPESTNAFPFGIEEEYFLHDLATKRAASTTPETLFREADQATNGQIGREFMQAQAEAATNPTASMSTARRELQEARGVLARLANRHGLAVLASGTHPTAHWVNTEQTDNARYAEVLNDLQMIGQRDMLCGMHVHVQLPDPGRRIEVMYRLLPYLPLFVALSTSSPFWVSRETGLKGYRLAAYDELPRTGLPELFTTSRDYEAYVEALVKAQVIKDATYIWWMIRPSSRYPTLELRAPDSCTHLADAIAIAALYRALIHHVYHHPQVNADLDAVDRAIIIENKWRAQRYGIHGTFVTKTGSVSVPVYLEQVLKLTASDADMLGCSEEVGQCRSIIIRGTSAEGQLGVYRARLGNGHAAALDAVVDWIRITTLQA